MCLCARPDADPGCPGRTRDLRGAAYDAHRAGAAVRYVAFLEDNGIVPAPFLRGIAAAG